MSPYSNHEIIVRAARWPEDCERLRQIRQDVFVEEQGVPVDIEWDGRDADSWHVLVMADAVPVATGRLQTNGKIGRMAVRRAWRGMGLGTRVLEQLIRIAHEQLLETVYLHAQQHATDFYLRHGFVTYGEPFEEAGIPHCAMRKQIDQTTSLKRRSDDVIG